MSSSFVQKSLVALMTLTPLCVWGQDYPKKPIRIVAPAPGGGGDLVARLIAGGISGPLGQQIIIDNRSGGVTLGEIVSKAQPDGYTLLLTGGFWLVPLLQDVPYDPVKDFLPITLVTSEPSVLVVHPSVPAKSVKELIALAKSKPAGLNYAASPIGTNPHLAAELFKAMAGVNIVYITYKAGGPALNAVLAGETQLMFASASAVVPYAGSSKLRALAVSSAQPSVLAPGLPTIAASGVPGYESISVNGMFAPAKTPAATITRLNQEIVRYLSALDVKEQFLKMGVEAVGSSPEQLAARMRSDIPKWSKVIKDAGIRAN